MLETLIEAWRGKSVLVLGGSGVIGSRLVEVLAAAPGVEVSVLVRNLVRAVRIARHRVELIRGEVLDRALLERSMAGRQVVVDLTFPKEGAALRERCAVARRMARTIGEAAASQGIERVVHLSTISVYGRPRGERLDEASPRSPGRDPYGASKLAGEDEMLRLHRERGLPVVVLQPTIVYGPFTGWSMGPLSQLSRGRFVLPGEGTGRCNAVYLDDVVQAILRAGTARGIDGEVFLVSGESAVTWREFYGAYEAMLGVQATASMPEAEIVEELARRARQNRPTRRLVALLKQDAQPRQLVLRLPIVSQGWALARALIPKRRLSALKDRLLERQSSSAGKGPSGAQGKPGHGPAGPLLFPTSVQMAVYASRAEVSIARSRDRLGYSPRYDLRRGMARTREWAQWARLLPERQGSTGSSGEQEAGR